MYADKQEELIIYACGYTKEITCPHTLRLPKGTCRKVFVEAQHYVYEALKANQVTPNDSPLL